MGMSRYLENALLNHSLKNTAYTQPTALYLALYTSDPTNMDTGTEVSGGSYARQSVAFNAASLGATSNTSTVTFPVATAGWGTVTYLGIRDASTGGNLLYSGALSVSQTVATGNQLIFNAGQITATLT